MGIRMVAIGGSWGGFRALTTILKGLPAWFEPPVVVVQHRKAGTHGGLEETLSSRCALPVVEPTDKARISPGHVYVAPADYHLLVEPDSFALSIDEPHSYSRPSIDVLFESVAHAFGAEAVGILLT